MITHKFNNKDIKIYSPERTIVEIIKYAAGKFNDVVMDTIRSFFTIIKYNRKKLIEFAGIFNVKQYVEAFMVACSERTTI